MSKTTKELGVAAPRRQRHVAGAHQTVDPVPAGSGTASAFRSLVLDDDLDAAFRTRLETLLARVADRLGRRSVVDYATTWNTRGFEPIGLQLFRENAYDLVVLDMVFERQAHQGYEIYNSIRSGEALRCLGSDLRCRVPIMLFSCGEGEAKVAISLVSTSATYAQTFIFYKEQLQKGETRNVEDSLYHYWAGDDIALHVLIPTGLTRADALQGMLLHFCRLGAGVPPRAKYKKPQRSAYKLIAEFTAPDEPLGKEDWACVVLTNHTYLGMSLTEIGDIFEKDVARVLQHRHPSGQIGWKKLNGVEEIHLHFDDPALFGLSEDCMVLSSRASGPRFVPAGLWPEELLGSRNESLGRR